LGLRIAGVTSAADAVGGESATQLDRIVWAVNSGGDRLVTRGVVWKADNPVQRQASGGTEAFIPVPVKGVEPSEWPLYQTERYGTSNFFYDIPTPSQEGRYTIVLKFAEVAWREPNKKIFNVVLNSKHTVIRDLDIYARVGHAAALDEYISFTIKNKLLKYRRKSSPLESTIRLEFVKGHNDNPKICAVAFIFGNTSLAHSLVGVEAETEPPKRMGDVGSSGEPASVASADDDVDLSRRSQKPRRRDAQSEGDGHPLPTNSVILGGLILIAVLLYENYAFRHA